MTCDCPCANPTATPENTQGSGKPDTHVAAHFAMRCLKLLAVPQPLAARSFSTHVTESLAVQDS